ncbi:hypothetical protein [Nocardiopsis halotolerans]|uniref:hypothetical protein n=1 Tax=Nocardiopsis halotolerans TaxID=124252 RepID=UPI000347EF10|nr:hypothetical protein [Nocardiopsis halotolerans]
MTYRGAGHRGTRRTIAVVTYVLTGAVTVAMIAAAVWLGVTTVQGVWAHALARIAAGS